MMSLKTKFSSLFLALFSLLLISSCDMQNHSDKFPDSPALQADGEDDGDGGFCDYGEFRKFPLTPIDNDDFEVIADLGFSLQTENHPYNRDSCVCFIEHFDFVFPANPSLPDEGLIRVIDKDNQDIPFELTDAHNPYQAIRIENPELIDRENLDIYIDWEEEGYTNTVLWGGGLCIIDNLDANDKNLMGYGPVYNPWISVLPGEDPGDDSIFKAIVPRIMTNPSNN